jgi:hypothetical protein
MVITSYLKYLRFYCDEIKLLYQSSYHSGDFKPLAERLYSAMRWHKYFSGQRLADFENFIISQDFIDYDIGVYSSMSRSYKDIKLPVSLRNSIKNGSEESEDCYNEKYNQYIYSIRKSPFFPPLKDAVEEFKEKIHLRSSHILLKKAIKIYFRTLVNLAVLQLIDIKRSIDPGFNADTVLEEFLPSASADIKKNLQCAEQVYNAIDETNYKGYGIMLKLLKFKDYNFHNQDIELYMDFIRKAKPSKSNTDKIHKLFMLELDKLPFMKFEVQKFERKMLTPAGVLDLSYIYEPVFSEYKNTDDIVLKFNYDRENFMKLMKNNANLKLSEKKI